jgi:hypothetical protein
MKTRITLAADAKTLNALARFLGEFEKLSTTRHKYAPRWLVGTNLVFARVGACLIKPFVGQMNRPPTKNWLRNCAARYLVLSLLFHQKPFAVRIMWFMERWDIKRKKTPFWLGTAWQRLVLISWRKRECWSLWLRSSLRKQSNLEREERAVKEQRPQVNEMYGAMEFGLLALGFLF